MVLEGGNAVPSGHLRSPFDEWVGTAAMVEREVLLETAVAVLGTAILAGIIVVAGALSGPGTSRSDANLVVVGIVVFILFMAVGGYWLYRQA